MGILSKTVILSCIQLNKAGVENKSVKEVLERKERKLYRGRTYHMGHKSHIKQSQE